MTITTEIVEKVKDLWHLNKGHFFTHRFYVKKNDSKVGMLLFNVVIMYECGNCNYQKKLVEFDCQNDPGWIGIWN